MITTYDDYTSLASLFLVDDRDGAPAPLDLCHACDPYTCYMCDAHYTVALHGYLWILKTVLRSGFCCHYEVRWLCGNFIHLPRNEVVRYSVVAVERIREWMSVLLEAEPPIKDTQHELDNRSLQGTLSMFPQSTPNEEHLSVDNRPCDPMQCVPS